ncbi:hypothetical protein MCHI_001217 [Candidatus Magnetoovum chiemensis]|nr:hypothetical protein MCHI_001217 [Candidatus Magnetoovum chiemensis]
MHAKYGDKTITLKETVLDVSKRINTMVKKVTVPTESAIRRNLELPRDTFKRMPNQSKRLFELTDDEIDNIISKLDISDEEVSNATKTELRKAFGIETLEQPKSVKTPKEDVNSAAGVETLENAEGVKVPPKKPYHVTIDVEGVRHAFERHGSEDYKRVLGKEPLSSKSATREVKQEIPITRKDFTKAPEIISKPNYIEYRPKVQQTDRETFAFYKYYEKGGKIEEYRVVLRIEHGKKQLVIQSLFKDELEITK